MAETDAEAIATDGAAADNVDFAPPRKRGKKKLVLIAVALLVVLLGGGCAGAYFMGMLDPLLGGEAAGETAAADEQAVSARPAPVYFDLPEFIVNLNNGNRRSLFFKLRARLELEDPGAVAEVQRQMPRIVDAFQVYLRELRLDELEGSAGTYRLREELLRRVSAEVVSVRVNDLLFVEVMVQ